MAAQAQAGKSDLGTKVGKLLVHPVTTYGLYTLGNWLGYDAATGSGSGRLPASWSVMAADAASLYTYGIARYATPWLLKYGSAAVFGGLAFYNALDSASLFANNVRSIEDFYTSVPEIARLSSEAWFSFQTARSAVRSLRGKGQQQGASQ